MPGKGANNNNVLLLSDAPPLRALAPCAKKKTLWPTIEFVQQFFRQTKVKRDYFLHLLILLTDVP